MKYTQKASPSLSAPSIRSEFPYEESRIAVLPIPYEATTSFGTGTATGRARSSRPLVISSSTMRRRRPMSTTRYLHPSRSSNHRFLSGPYGGRDLRRGQIHSRSTRSFWSRWAASTPSRRRWSRPTSRSIPGLCVLQIDAHGDLRESYEGSEYSHACAMRRVLELARARSGRDSKHFSGRNGEPSFSADPDFLRP